MDVIFIMIALVAIIVQNFFITSKLKKMGENYDALKALLDQMNRAVEGIRQDVTYLKNLPNGAMTAEEVADIKARATNIAGVLDALDAETDSNPAPAPEPGGEG